MPSNSRVQQSRDEWAFQGCELEVNRDEEAAQWVSGHNQSGFSRYRASLPTVHCPLFTAYAKE
jgi:hypothetical protein